MYICKYILLYYIYDREYIITKRLLVIICDYHWIIGLIIVYYIVHYYWIIFSIKRKKKKNYNICCGSPKSRSILNYLLRFSCCPQHMCPFLLRFKTATFKIGHLLLSLMLGAKIAAYYDKKITTNEIFSTSIGQIFRQII